MSESKKKKIKMRQAARLKKFCKCNAHLIVMIVVNEAIKGFGPVSNHLIEFLKLCSSCSVPCGLEQSKAGCKVLL